MKVAELHGGVRAGQAEDYVHRVGRVGRAEALGLAISLVSEVPEKVRCRCSAVRRQTPRMHDLHGPPRTSPAARPRLPSPPRPPPSMHS